MRKYLNYSIALCALLLPGLAMGTDCWWMAGDSGDDWATAASWWPGVPTASDRALISGATDYATVGTAGAVAGEVVLQGSLTVASAGELTAGALNANQTTASTLVVDGQLIHGGSSWFQFGGTGGSTLTVNSGGSITSSGSEFLIGQGGNASLTVAGTFSRAGWLHLGAGNTGNITVNSGGLLDIGVVQTAAGSIAGLTINGGVSTVDTLGWGNGGTGTLDMNGGQLTITGFLDTPANTYNIGDGELFFTGTDVATVDARVSGANWNFADTKSVVDLGGDNIGVTSIPEPATMALVGIFGAAMFSLRRFRV